MQSETIGQRIRRLRFQNGMTQKQLSNILYVSVQTVSAWEHDKTDPDIRTIISLGQVFHVSLDELLTGKKTH